MPGDSFTKTQPWQSINSNAADTFEAAAFQTVNTLPPMAKTARSDKSLFLLSTGETKKVLAEADKDTRRAMLLERDKRGKSIISRYDENGKVPALFCGCRSKESAAYERW